MKRFFTKKFKVNKTNIFLFSFLLTQIAVPTFELFKPSSANGTEIGSGASSTGSASTAIGPVSSASGSASTAIGLGTNASGEFSTALGGGEKLYFNNEGASASGDYSTAIGSETTASHNRSTAIGTGATTDKDNQIVIGTSEDTVTVKGELVVGVDGEYTLITREGITVDGIPLITENANGEIHIGKNSLITTNEEKTLPNGKKVQPLYAKDLSGNLIPIDVRSKLLINGRDIEQSINNVGAMSAALTGLPTVPTDTTLACGLGTGTHGGDFAFSGGCASKVNENLSVNYAASMIMPSQDFAGDFEDQFSARAGFVWKLGKSNEPTKISLNESKELKKEVQDLKAKNATLLARLEKLENIAFKLQKNEGLKLSKGL